MASAVWPSSIRHLVPRQAFSASRAFQTQRRWAQVSNVRFLATHNTQERVLSKYKDKLQEKAREQGFKDVSELQEAHKEKIDKLRKEAAVPGATAPLTPPPTPSSSPPSYSAAQPMKTPASAFPPPPPPPKPQEFADEKPPPPGVKTLNSFLDLSKIASLPNKEIETLWRLRHASNPQSLHFALPSKTFNSLLSAAKRHPNFVLPLPKQARDDEVPDQGAGQAAEMHYLQWAHPHPKTTTLLFTSLAEFKLRGEFASPHTTITFHSELGDSHNLVLGQGTVMENRGVSVDEARWLVMCMQKFYVVEEEGHERGQLLEMFSRGDGGFRVEKLLEEAEKIV